MRAMMRESMVEIDSLQSEARRRGVSAGGRDQSQNVYRQVSDYAFGADLSEESPVAVVVALACETYVVPNTRSQNGLVTPVAGSSLVSLMWSEEQKISSWSACVPKPRSGSLSVREMVHNESADRDREPSAQVEDSQWCIICQLFCWRTYCAR